VNNKPYFSIITPSLNSEKTIQRTVESVLSQKFASFEYAVIDGFSSDTTLSKIPKTDDRISIKSEKDLGIYDAMNKGIRNANGVVVGIINSDDWYLPDAFETVQNHFESTGVDIAIGGVELFKDGVKVGSRIHFETEIQNHMVSHPAVFVKKTVYQNIGGFNPVYRIAADYDFLLRAFAKGVKFSHIPVVISAYSLGGFSDLPRNRIQSILETESIKLQNKVIARNKALLRFLRFSLKTIAKRDSKRIMIIELVKCIKRVPFYFAGKIKYETR